MRDRFNLLAMTLTTLCAVSLGTLALTATPASAQCDVPLISQRISTPPNVMILLDSSGSMNGVMYHAEYDQTVTWSGELTWTTNYKVTTAGSYTPNSFLSSAGDDSTTASLVSGLTDAKASIRETT